MQYFVVVLSHQRQLESVLGRIDRDRSRLGISVEAMNDLSFDSCEVDWLIEGLDDSVVTVATYQRRYEKGERETNP